MRSILKLLLSKNPLREMAATDRKVLAVCIGAAFVFWLILNLSRDYSINRPVSVAYQVDPERVLVGNMPEQLDARISGSGWNLIWESLRPTPASVAVDVRNRENFRLSSMDLERQIRRNLSSGQLTVSLPGFEATPVLTTPKEGKRVPLVNRVRVQFAEGHVAVAAAALLPDSVTINGSLDALEDISEWPTEELNLTQIAQPVIRSVNLVSPPKGLTLSRNEVGYNLPVEAFIQQTLLVPVRVANGRPGTSYEYAPKNVTLTINVPQSIFGSLRAQDFDVVIDLGDEVVGETSKNIPLTVLRKPATARIIRMEPQVAGYYVVQ